MGRPTDGRSPAHVFRLGDDGGVLDALHLLLVALSVMGCVLLGLLQGRLQAFDPLSRGPQALLHLGDLTAQVGVVPHQLQRGKQMTENRVRGGGADGHTGPSDTKADESHSIVSFSYLLVDFGQLLEVVLQETDLLFLGGAAL